MPSTPPTIRPRAARGYRRISILTAEPAKVIMELLQGAITSLSQANREGSIHPELDAARALSIVGELDLFLDFDSEPQVAKNFMTLYAHLRQRLGPCCRKFDPEVSKEVLSVLSILKEGWVEVHRKRERR